MATSRLILQAPPTSLPALKTLIGLGEGFVRDLCRALEETGPSLDDSSLRAVSVCNTLQRPDLVEAVEVILEDVIKPIVQSIYSHGAKSADFVDAISELFDGTRHDDISI